MISDRIIIKRASTYGYSVYRAKVQSLDDKYTTPWVRINGKVAKNKEKYNFKIIIYKNDAITFLYEKK